MSAYLVYNVVLFFLFTQFFSKKIVFYSSGIVAVLSPLLYEFPKWAEPSVIRIINPNNPTEASYRQLPQWGEWDLNGTYIYAKAGPREFTKRFLIKEPSGVEVYLDFKLKTDDGFLFAFESSRAKKTFVDAPIFSSHQPPEAWIFKNLEDLLSWSTHPSEEIAGVSQVAFTKWLTENKITSAKLTVTGVWVNQLKSPAPARSVSALSE